MKSHFKQELFPWPRNYFSKMHNYQSFCAFANAINTIEPEYIIMMHQEARDDQQEACFATATIHHSNVNSLSNNCRNVSVLFPGAAIPNYVQKSTENSWVVTHWVLCLSVSFKNWSFLQKDYQNDKLEALLIARESRNIKLESEKEALAQMEHSPTSKQVDGSHAVILLR